MIADFFGTKIKYKLVEGGFEVEVSSTESEGLIFWLMQYGIYIRVLAPESVKVSLREHLQQVIEMNG